jgi:hypothetical protein
MTAISIAATPREVSPFDQGALKFPKHQKMLKMKIAPQSLLKTKGQKE